MVNFSGLRALVIGGTGFIGGRLAERLLVEENAKVRVLVRNWTTAAWVSRSTAELVAGDVLDVDSLAKAVEGCDVVFHCASGEAPDGGYVRTNRDGTRNLIDVCRRLGVGRVVYLSSVAVHGNVQSGQIGESSPRPLSGRAYSDSKILAEDICFDAWQKHAFPVVVLRPTYVWGPRSALFTVRQLREMKAGSFQLVDGGQGNCNAVFVEHLVDAMLLAAGNAKADGQTFLVTDDFGVRWIDFFRYYSEFLQISTLASIQSDAAIPRLGSYCVDHLRAVVDALKGARRSIPVRATRRLARDLLSILARRYPSQWDIKKYASTAIVDITKAREILGYEPRFTLSTAMKETLEWVTDQMGLELFGCDNSGWTQRHQWVAIRSNSFGRAVDAKSKAPIGELGSSGDPNSERSTAVPVWERA